MSPTISVIIPTFNIENHIKETLDCILEQTFKDIEIIVIDDGSTDKTTAIVQSYGNKVRLITQNNAGVCIARNRGLREARGQFVCFMDHDDYWYPEKLTHQIKTFQKFPEAGVVYTHFINWRQDSNGNFPSPETIIPPDTADEVDADFSGWIYHQFLLDCWMLTSTAMFRIEIFDYCGGAFDANLPYSEDWELWIRIARQYPMIKLQRASTLYRQHSQQGNRIIRPIDYRTKLLSDTAKKWGLSSKDGRCVKYRTFRNQLARYHANFALSHLRGGSRRIALQSFAKAWVCAPFSFEYIAYILAILLGWRQK